MQYHKTTNKGHGRLEMREIWASTQMNEWFQRDWAGIAHIFKIRRYWKNKWKEEEEIVYGITHLERAKADARRLLELNREHWSSENRLHYRRDIMLGEDSNQTRKKGIPEVIAALHGGLLTILDFLGRKNVTKYMRYCCTVPKDALHSLIYAL
jgi:predicted transposase YbfD/YdcC